MHDSTLLNNGQNIGGSHGQNETLAKSQAQKESQSQPHNSSMFSRSDLMIFWITKSGEESENNKLLFISRQQKLPVQEAVQVALLTGLAGAGLAAALATGNFDSCGISCVLPASKEAELWLQTKTRRILAILGQSIFLFQYFGDL